MSWDPPARILQHYLARVHERYFPAQGMGDKEDYIEALLDMLSAHPDLPEGDAVEGVVTWGNEEWKLLWDFLSWGNDIPRGHWILQLGRVMDVALLRRVMQGNTRSATPSLVWMRSPLGVEYAWPLTAPTFRVYRKKHDHIDMAPIPFFTLDDLSGYTGCVLIRERFSLHEPSTVVGPGPMCFIGKLLRLHGYDIGGRDRLPA